MVARVPSSSCSVGTECEFSGAEGEEDQREDLKAKTGYHDVLAEVAARARVCCGSNGTTESLKDETDEVTPAEDDCVGPWLEKRKMLTVNGDDAGEAEVDGCGEECGCNGQGDEVPEEVVVVEWVVV